MMTLRGVCLITLPALSITRALSLIKMTMLLFFSPEKADNTYMEAVEPFNYQDAVEFSGAYLSGYLADKYDVSTEDSIERANERVKNSTIEAFNDTTNRYTAVIPESSRVGFSNGKIRYSLLPVWMLNIKYMDKMYKFAINGQTGKLWANILLITAKSGSILPRLQALRMWQPLLLAGCCYIEEVMIYEKNVFVYVASFNLNDFALTRLCGI